ncbi:MAG: alcohol dehydrogenase, partial [Planctomycetota bacterium]
MVTDHGVYQAGLVAPLVGESSKLEMLAGTFDAVPAEPELHVVDRLAELLRESKADCVIGIGGGSVMDATKVASIVAVHGGNARDYCGIGKVPGRGLPSVLIPTTAGTGSEATFVAILTEPLQGNKVGVVSPHLLADIAIVDPALTDNLPKAITAATGFDAIVHAMEAMIAKVATPVARALALQAASYLGPNLETAVLNGQDSQARDAMAIGSHLAGLAFANSSCCAV